MMPIFTRAPGQTPMVRGRSPAARSASRSRLARSIDRTPLAALRPPTRTPPGKPLDALAQRSARLCAGASSLRLPRAGASNTRQRSAAPEAAGFGRDGSARYRSYVQRPPALTLSAPSSTLRANTRSSSNAEVPCSPNGSNRSGAISSSTSIATAIRRRCGRSEPRLVWRPPRRSTRTWRILNEPDCWKRDPTKPRALELVGRERREPAAETVVSETTISLPLLGEIAAGSPLLAAQNIEEYLAFPHSTLAATSCSGSEANQ